MTKPITSRLQSRLAKRRAVIAGLEYDVGLVKSSIVIARRLNASFVRLGVEPIVLDNAYAELRHLRAITKEAGQDQQLDKELLRQAYFRERFGFLSEMAVVATPIFEVKQWPGRAHAVGDIND